MTDDLFSQAVSHPSAEHCVQEIRSLAATAKHTAERLKKETDEAVRRQCFWDKVLEYVQNDWHFHLMDLVRREGALAASQTESKPVPVAALDSLVERANREAEVIKRRFPKLFDDFCQDANLPLDRTSAHPRYTLEDQFILVEIDERRNAARVSDRESQLAQLPMDIPAIVEVLKREHSRLFGREFNASRFLKKLRAQYKAIIRKEKSADGVSLPIRKITHRLGKNEKGFRTDEFLIDLSRLVENGPLEIRGYRLDLGQTKDTKQGMLLHGSAGRGYIGFITFRKV